MATKTQVTKLLAQQGADWSEKKYSDEYEFECGLPQPYIWDSGHGCGSFAQTLMRGESMRDFWDDVMTMINHPVIVDPHTNDTPSTTA